MSNLKEIQNMDNSSFENQGSDKRNYVSKHQFDNMVLRLPFFLYF